MRHAAACKAIRRRSEASHTHRCEGHTHVKGTDEERLVVWPKCDDASSSRPRAHPQRLRRIVLAAQGQRIELRRALAEQRAAALVRHLDAELARKLISGCDLERVGHDAGHELAALAILRRP